MCAQTFPPIFKVFAIFDRNIVTLLGHRRGHSMVHLKEQSFLKKMKTASKSTHHITILVQTMSLTRRQTKRVKQKHHIFALYSRRT